MRESGTISITANGESHAMARGYSLVEFLNSLGLHPDRVVVERNRGALTPSEARETILSEGDVLEIVRIVAGG